ncbi:MAG: hypothetical protein KAJ17_06650, partial [Candidatus Krumholzibacteria bacterium]|nr:hypothetical protein [Candidatus Krumholzibacteria bacterium]
MPTELTAKNRVLLSFSLTRSISTFCLRATRAGSYAYVIISLVFFAVVNAQARDMSFTFSLSEQSVLLHDVL